MTRRLMCGWPLSLWVLASPACLVVLLVLSNTWSMFGWRYGEWRAASAETHESLLMAGPVAATAASYYGGRLCGRRSLLCLAMAPRAGYHLALRHLVVLIAWFTTSHLLALLPLLAMTASTASAGRPYILEIASGLVGMAAVTAAGYCLGVAAGTPLVAPVAAVATFMFLQLGNGGSPAWSGIVPVYGMLPGPSEAENSALAGYRLLALSTLILAAIGIANVFMARRGAAGSPLRPTLGGLAAWLTLPVIFAVLPSVHAPAVIVPEQDSPYNCRRVEGVRVCVHRAHLDDLPALERMTASILDVIPDPPVQPSGVYDTDLRHVFTGKPNDPWLDVDPGRPLERAVPLDIASAVSGELACRPRLDSHRTELDERRDVTAAQLAAWIVLQTDYDPFLGYDSSTEGSNTRPANLRDYAGPFGDMTPSHVRTWVDAHRRQLATCTVPAEELP